MKHTLSQWIAKEKFIVTETVPEICYEERPIPGNNRSEYLALIQADAEHRRVHQKTTEKLVDMISAQEELQIRDRDSRKPTMPPRRSTRGR